MILNKSDQVGKGMLIGKTESDAYYLLMCYHLKNVKKN
jgi:hypothetical protein